MTIENEKRSTLRLPTSGFNTALQKAYLKYPNGTREYVKKKSVF